MLSPSERFDQPQLLLSYLLTLLSCCPCIMAQHGPLHLKLLSRKSTHTSWLGCLHVELGLIHLRSLIPAMALVCRGVTERGSEG